MRGKAVMVNLHEMWCVVERSTSREWWISFSCKASCLKQCDRDNVEKN